VFGRVSRERAFESEVLPHLDAAYRLAYALTGQRADAEDLVQEACLRAYAAFERYEMGTNARAWLLTILRRVHLNDRRRLSTHPTPLTLDGSREGDAPRDVADLSALAPDEEAVRAGDRATLLAALAELPEEYRAVLALVDLDGLRYAEAAEVLGCPIGTVMSRLHRGRQRLGAKLRNAGFGAETGVVHRTQKRVDLSPRRASAAGRIVREACSDV
jgi:RNA polymerase sigma-70 factor (ECF subfamily)